jgi:hypothetical protein
MVGLKTNPCIGPSSPEGSIESIDVCGSSPYSWLRGQVVWYHREEKVCPNTTNFHFRQDWLLRRLLLDLLCYLSPPNLG